MTTSERLSRFREILVAEAIDAFIVPRADEYLGEYVPAHNERLAWLTGFTGSAGMAVVTREQAALFIDGRYTEQAATQVADCFQQHHLLNEPPLEWLTSELAAGSVVGIDTRLHTYAFFIAARRLLESHNITLKELIPNPIDRLWQDRPAAPKCELRLLDTTLTGETSADKRRRVGKAIADAGATHAVISQLDAIAWLLNIRGTDVPHLPVVLGSAVLEANGAMTFFTDPGKFDNLFQHHAGDHVSLRVESELAAFLGGLTEDSRVLIDNTQCNAFATLRCEESAADVVAGRDPVLLAKAAKNEVELQGIRACHVRDGVAVSRYLAWLEHQASGPLDLDEADAANRLLAFREQDESLADLSFSTISATGANAAMPHYNHNNGVPAKLRKGDLYLVDSGGQYPDGTTDITRTVALDHYSVEHQINFTRVLKGHIALANAAFPVGTTGVQLDVLARQFLWQAGLDYDHGTGHGVGCFLSVHEGPQRIGKLPVNDGTLLPGMVLSNEPGYYKAGAYGIRCENLMIVCARDDGFLCFETITFAPFDRRLIDVSLMTASELSWLNHYHQQVREKLAPLMIDAERPWLIAATAAIT